MKLAKFGGIALGVIVLIGVGLFVAKGPQPEIVVPAEQLWKAGPLKISNTMFTAWIVIAFLVVVSWLGTRSMKLLPGGLQNFLEAGVGFLVDQIESIAGEAKGRVFFSVIATIFLFVLVSNWAGLLPFFNAIGKTEDVGHEIFHELSEEHPSELTLKDGVYVESEKFAGWVMDDAGGLIITKHNAKAVDFEVHAGETPGKALDRFIVFLAAKFGDLEATDEDIEAPSAALITAAAAELKANPTAPKLITGAHAEGEAGAEAHGLESPVLHERISGVDFEHSQKMALVIPFFRGVFSDVNNTLALGLIAFCMIEFWGFQFLGIRYLGKFFVNPLKSPIGFGVGLLELLSEFIRVISFTFRLFGNIFAGEVLVLMLTFLMPFVLVDIIYGLELFVGFIQASVFALLTLVFAVMATESHGEGEHHEPGAEPGADHHGGAAQAH